jgi:hypothetical protein
VEQEDAGPLGFGPLTLRQDSAALREDAADDTISHPERGTSVCAALFEGGEVMMSTTAPVNIFQKIQAVMRAVSYVQKDANVKTGGSGSYTAVTHDQVTALVRPHFVEHGIVIVPRLVTSTMIDTGRKSSAGTPMLRFEALFEVSFVNADDPKDMVTIPVASHAEDLGDKAPGKALSYAVKMSILKILMLESGDADESRIPQPKMTADDLVSINNKIESAADIDALREAVADGLGWAEDSNDTSAYQKIKDWGISASAKFGASAPDRKPVKAKAQPAKDKPQEPPPATAPVEPPNEARMVPPQNNEPLARPGMIKIIRAKLARIGVPEERALAVHHLTTFDNITLADGNVILASISQGKDYYA